MQNILRLPLCQGTFSKSKNYKKANNPVNHGTIELISHELSEENIHGLEKISFARAKEALTKNLLTPREVMQVFSNLEAAREANEIFKQRSAQALPANIDLSTLFRTVSLGIFLHFFVFHW